MGPGPARAGDNTFSYFVDPTGNVTEYTSELQQIEEDECWVAQVHPTGEAESDLWSTAGLMSEYIPYAIGAPDPGLWTPAPV